MASRTKLPTDWHFARPELARHYLNAFEIGLVSGIALYARRRHGKSEFLTRDLQPAALAQGYAVGYCNLWQEDEDPAQALAEAARALAMPKTVRAKLMARLQTPVTKFKLSGKAAGLGEGGAEVEFKDANAVGPRQLRDLFTRFDQSKNLGLLLIDEAQVLAQPQHAPLEKALRALLDTRKDRLKVIFTGSSEDRLRAMFGAERKVFYNWASVEPMPLLGEAFVRELTDRANRLTTLQLKPVHSLAAFRELNGVPELFRRFLAQYLANPFEGAAAAVAQCKRSVYAEGGFDKRMRDLLPADRYVLGLVAAGQEDLHSGDTLKKMGQELGLRRPASRAVPQNALRRLRERQILLAMGNGVYEFEDEAFREWVLEQRERLSETNSLRK